MSARGSLLHWLRELARNLRHGARRDAELRDEVGSYLDLLTDEKVAAGLPPEAARRAALLELGGVEAVTEETRNVRAGALIGECWQDASHALRLIRRDKTFTAVAVLTLALGIGANTAMFSVVHGVLLRPLPFSQSERLATVWLTYPHWREREVLSQFWNAITLSYPEYTRLRDGTKSLEAVSIYRMDMMTLTGLDRPEIINVGSADEALPSVLGVHPAIGRWFSRGEAAPPGTRLAVLTDAFWRTRFGGDRSVVGASVRLDDQQYTVVGILPEGFRFTRPGASAAPDVWVPIGTLGLPFDENNHAFDAIARLRAGASFASAEEETALLLRGERPAASRGARVVPRKEEEIDGVRPTLILLWGAAGLILVIACVNVTNLLLGRYAEREYEFALRHALGAGRRRIARQLTVEGLLFGILGGATGALVAWLGTGALTAALPDDLPRLHEIRVDLTVLGFAFAATLLAPLLFGVLPALLAARRAADTRLREGGLRITGRSRLQHALVGIQVALALALLVGAGLLTRSLAELWSVDPGFRRDGLLTFQISLPPTRYGTPAARDAFFARLDSALTAYPGVTSVTTSSLLPLSGGSASNSVWPASYGPEKGPKPEVQRRVVTPGYFNALGIPLIRGRGITDTDDGSAPPVLVASRSAVERLWPGRDPIGDLVELNDRWWTVVGIVEDVQDQSFRRAAQATLYAPSAQWPMATRSLIVRTAVPPLTLRPDISRIVRELDPELPITGLRSMEEVAAAVVADERFRAGLLGGIAALAIVLAGVGLFSVVSHGVTRRTRELGIRMALGAGRNRVMRLVLRQAAATVAFGLAAGLALAASGSRALDAFLFGVPGVDPMTYAGTAALMTCIALAAAFVPAWRATRVDPLRTLRQD